MSGVWNDTAPNGGNSLTDAIYMNGQYTTGDIAWITFAAAIVWIMIPGIGFFYGGLARRKSSLALVFQSCMCVSIISFQWFFWGYSLTFSHTANRFIGNLNNFGMINTLGAASVGSPWIPDLLFNLFQLVFSAATAMIVMGGAMERGAIGPSCVFIFIWSTIVYDPIACWTWNPNGFLYVLGSLDFAGGGPVHIASGSAALAYAVILGRRRDKNGQIMAKVHSYRPHNVTMVIIGIVFLWFGWFGFNGGSALNMSLRSVYAANNTNIAASCGLISWVLVDYFYLGKWSAVGAASGALAGLVAITPACGYIPVYFAVPVGVVAGVLCNFATKLKYVFNVDDGLDVFALHGVGGYAGNVMTGLFAADYVARLDGVSVISGGWIQHNWIQLGYQLAGATSIMAYSFTVSYLILFIMNKIPGLRLRVDEKSEMEGLDYSEIGEYAFEALTEKEAQQEAQFNLADIVGDAEANDHGGIVAK